MFIVIIYLYIYILSQRHRMVIATTCANNTTGKTVICPYICTGEMSKKICLFSGMHKCFSAENRQKCFNMESRELPNGS